MNMVLFLLSIFGGVVFHFGLAVWFVRFVCLFECVFVCCVCCVWVWERVVRWWGGGHVHKCPNHIQT
jgi:hypothetical protein